MEPSGAVSRRGLLLGGARAAVLGVAGCSASRGAPTPNTGSGTGASPATSGSTSGSAVPSTASPADRPVRVAYGVLFRDGEWDGPRSSNGDPSLSVVDDMLASKPGQAAPAYLRVGDVFAHSGANAFAAPSALAMSVVDRFKQAGVRLGVTVNDVPHSQGATGTQGSGSAGRSRQNDQGMGSHVSPLDAADLVALGRRIRQVSDAHGGIYDWIFVDHAAQLTPAQATGVNDLQQVVDGLTAAGWPRVMINATDFNANHFGYLPQRTWAMARHFEVMGADYATTVPTIVAGGQGAVTAADLQFVDYVRTNRAGTAALLKLEIASETQRFRLLSSADQLTLLRQWARAGQQDGYRMIYPLYLDHASSLTAGTFTEQRQLMAQYG